MNFVPFEKRIALKIQVRGEEIILSAERALYWPREKALVVADMHLGKTAHFRQFGIPVPSSLLSSDLLRLTSLIDKFLPKKLIVVGDMFHQHFNHDIELFIEWRSRFEGLQVVLVQGNHDKLKPLQYMNMDIEIYNPNLCLAPFQFVHEHKQHHEQFFTISGHVHPGVLLRGSARQSLKLPCFALNQHQVVLPAFSLFTGLDVSYCIDECDFYAIAAENVFKVG